MEFAFLGENLQMMQGMAGAGTGADKGAKASKVSFLINEKIIPYAEIYSNDKNSFKPQTKPFYFIYVPMSLSKVQRVKLIAKLQKKISEQHFD